MKEFIEICLALALALLPFSVFAQQSINWDTDHATLVGNGCKKDADSFVTQNGNDLSIIFTNLGVNLPGGSSVRALLTRSSCLSFVPATIAPGQFVGELTQNLTYGVTKTAHSIGSVYAQSRFFGFSVSPLPVNFAYGKQLNNPLANQIRKDQFNVRTTPQWFQGWCARSRPTKGFFEANIIVSGQRDNPNEDLIMFVDGMDLKFEVGVTLKSC